ncbi:MAG: GNAT family N-acetyltransferase [Ruminiclostridium sp.]|nr:GNAT family N-acetyltransferase [Ruminiclostridium sp.]
MVEQVLDVNKKREISKFILESLKEWFEKEESRNSYIEESVSQLFFTAKENDKYIGFLCLKETGEATVELSVMGVLRKFHRKGTGRALFEYAKNVAKECGYSFIQVKTVRMGIYEDYDKTNMFYKSLGFKEFEVFPTLWDENNPCQVYVMSI